MTDTVWPQVEAWQQRCLSSVSARVDLAAMDVHVRRAGRLERSAGYIALGLDPAGRQDAVGHWLGDGLEGAKFWMNGLGELQARGVSDILRACRAGLTGFADAVRCVFPNTVIQRCMVHHSRNPLKYVVYKDQDAFLRDLQALYKAPTRDQAEPAGLNLSERWSDQAAVAVHSWQTNWADLSSFFNFAA